MDTQAQPHAVMRELLADTQQPHVAVTVAVTVAEQEWPPAAACAAAVVECAAVVAGLAAVAAAEWAAS
jgi:hypothetical protein